MKAVQEVDLTEVSLQGLQQRQISTTQKARYRIGRLCGSPWGASSFFLLVYSPSASRKQLTPAPQVWMLECRESAGNHTRPGNLKEANITHPTVCCSTAVMSSTSCSSLLNPSVQGKEKVKQ
jgi:hypothetical protein